MIETVKGRFIGRRNRERDMNESEREKDRRHIKWIPVRRCIIYIV